MDYYKYKEYKDFKKSLIDNKESFEVSETNYTAKVKWNDTTSMYNKDGRPNNQLLTLINKVRQHNKGKIEKEVEGIDYFKLFQFPKKPVDCFKIDLSAAYWTAGMIKNVITPEMDEKVEMARFYDENNKRIWNQKLIVKKKKDLKLVSMGSLATTKTNIIYKEGIEVDRIPTTQDTKNVYLGIHKFVDDIMKDISNRYECYYYYFDCFFTKDKRVIDAIKEYGFDCKVEKSKIKVDSILNMEDIFVHDLLSGIRYNVKKEDYI